MAESFFAALKNERVHRTQYPTREHARRDVVRYIDTSIQLHIFTIDGTCRSSDSW